MLLGRDRIELEIFAFFHEVQGLFLIVSEAILLLLRFFVSGINNHVMRFEIVLDVHAKLFIGRSLIWPIDARTV